MGNFHSQPRQNNRDLINPSYLKHRGEKRKKRKKKKEKERKEGRKKKYMKQRFLRHWASGKEGK